uniref:Uncharacterized protein n=1 Tax=Anguilla anguilla TaxID=7936 RepID=A0A0E9XGT6_ANGAN
MSQRCSVWTLLSLGILGPKPSVLLWGEPLLTPNCSNSRIWDQDGSSYSTLSPGSKTETKKGKELASNVTFMEIKVNLLTSCQNCSSPWTIMDIIFCHLFYFYKYCEYFSPPCHQGFKVVPWSQCGHTGQLLKS